MNKTYIEQYAEEIRKGNIVAGYWIKKELDNLLRDLSDPRYIFDPRPAYKRIKFQEQFCLQSNAPYYMEPVKLMLWQKAWWEALYSFKMADTGLRRFTEGLLLVARKNGKSTMFAADGNTDLFIGAGGTSICCASNDDRQAKLIWREIAGMRGRLDPKKELTGQNLVEIRNHAKNITIFRLSSKTQNKDGFNIDKTFLDESHDIDEENEQSEIAEACWRSMSTKPEPLFLNCTTQGFNRKCYLDKKIETAKAIINGERDNSRFLAFLYEQDSEAEIWQDETSWEKSNPSLRYGVKSTIKLRNDVEDAKYDNGSRIHLLCKDFNIPQNTAKAWLMLEDYDYEQEIFDLEEFRGCFCLAAVDLSETTDLTNCKLLFMRPEDRTKYIYSHYWMPESKLENSDDKEAGAKYKEWVQQGFITICEGNDNDLTMIGEWMLAIYNKYKIRPIKCGYDVRFARDFLRKMEELNVDTEVIQQSPAVMSSPMRLVEADLKSRLINYGNNPVDKWCLANGAIEVNNKGQQLCVKIGNQPSRRIDGAVTLIILYATLQRFRSEFMSCIGYKE